MPVPNLQTIAIALPPVVPLKITSTPSNGNCSILTIVYENLVAGELKYPYRYKLLNQGVLKKSDLTLYPLQKANY